MGQFTQAEVKSAKGRADAIVKTPKYIYVFEFKLNGTAEEALQQIEDKGYLIPYQADGRWAWSSAQKNAISVAG